MLFSDLLTGGTGETRILRPDSDQAGPGGSLLVSESARADAVARLLGK